MSVLNSADGSHGREVVDHYHRYEVQILHITIQFFFGYLGWQTAVPKNMLAVSKNLLEQP